MILYSRDKKFSVDIQNSGVNSDTGQAAHRRIEDYHSDRLADLKRIAGRSLTTREQMFLQLDSPPVTDSRSSLEKIKADLFNPTPPEDTKQALLDDLLNDPSAPPPWYRPGMTTRERLAAHTAYLIEMEQAQATEASDRETYLVSIQPQLEFLQNRLNEADDMRDRQPINETIALLRANNPEGKERFEAIQAAHKEANLAAFRGRQSQAKELEANLVAMRDTLKAEAEALQVDE